MALQSNPSKRSSPMATLALHLTLLCLSTSGCSRHFTQVDFKYSSDAHLPPKARFLSVKASPNAVARLVSDFIAKHGGVIEQSETALSFKLEPTDRGEEAWKATRAVFEREWAAYSQNDPSAYDAIVRTAPLLGTAQIIQRDESNTGGTWTVASLAQRIGERTRWVITVFVTFSVRESEEIRTRLHVFTWPAADGGTLIYARGVPYLPQYGIEAAPGNWVAYELWRSTTGIAEAQLVGTLFDYVSKHLSGGELTNR